MCQERKKKEKNVIEEVGTYGHGKFKEVILW